MKWKNKLKQEWKIRPCWSGKDCWCRRICTKSGTIVVDGAFLYKDVASYLTALHNAFLRKTKLNYKKFKNICFFGDECGEKDELQKINKKWKVIKCGIKNCPCREIETKDGYNIVSAGSLNKQEAKYFIKLHNHFLKKKNKMAMSKTNNPMSRSVIG